jgi:exonuclease SbcC
MKVKKIKIKNLFGIAEYEVNGSSLELSGENGVGKTSVIDAIRYALTNKSNREYIVRKGQSEGEILIETDNGLRINRKPRTNQVDYKSVKKDGHEIGSPEAFLRDIFTPLQLNPIEFMNMDKKEQNSIILDMIQFDWDLNWIKEQFGEIPPEIDYSQNILSVLNDIQSEKGYYFRSRQDVNRDIRNKRAFISDIADGIPEGYQAETWEDYNLSEIYSRIEIIRNANDQIQRAKQIVETRDNKVRAFQADREIAVSALEREQSTTRNRLEKQIERLKAEITAAEKELNGLEEKKADKLAVINKQYEVNVAKYDAQVEEYKELSEKEPQDFSELQEKAAYAEAMKGYVNEYRRMERLQEELDALTQESTEYTSKIEKARTLPGEILEKATIPINGLTVENGIPLINGLPVSNLSDGQKLDLCVDVALQKPNGLQIILIDGVEKLSTKMRESLYTKCKERGLQFIATRTTDDPDLTVIEL